MPRSWMCRRCQRTAHRFGRFSSCACVYHPEGDPYAGRRNQEVRLTGSFELLSQIKTENITTVREVSHISGLNAEGWVQAINTKTAKPTQRITAGFDIEILKRVQAGGREDGQESTARRSRNHSGRSVGVSGVGAYRRMRVLLKNKILNLRTTEYKLHNHGDSEHAE